MATLKQKGDLAELMVALDLRRRGYKVAFPYGEDWDYDLIVELRDGMWSIHLRLTPPARRRKNVRFACDYLDL